MVLVDTSIWIDHLRQRDERLTALLTSNAVLVHPAIIGEIALGNLQNPTAVMSTLMQLPMAKSASEPEVLELIKTRALAGTGIGYIDAHLVAAVLLTPGSRLWTSDRRLASVVQRLSLAFAPEN